MKHNRISALAKKQVKDKMIVESIDRITINHGLYRFLDKNDFEIISHRLEEKGEKEREVITIVVENNKI